MDNILLIKNLNYKSIFKDLNLNIKKNTFNLITGSNKCGKTTLIKILSGLIEIKDTCFYNSRDITKLKSLEYATNFSSIIFTGIFKFTFSTLDQELLYHLDKVNLTISERKMKYKHLVKIFELDNYMYEDINNLSYFDKIKGLVMCSVIRSPKVLLLDNILDDLSDNEGQQIIESLKHIGGMTVIIGSSRLNLSEKFDYIHVIDKGQVVLSGETFDILKEDSTLNKIGLSLPFMVDLSLKLKYYGLIDDIILDMNRMVDNLWK